MVKVTKVGEDPPLELVTFQDARRVQWVNLFAHIYIYIYIYICKKT